MQYATGKLLTPAGFVSGHIGFEDGLIREVGKGQKKDALAKGLILPSLTNAHTHIGDSCLRTRLKKYRGARTVTALFCPPTGFKHRHLARASSRELVSGMRSSLGEMARTGTAAFCDFREGGVKGLEMLALARIGSPLKGLALGRPSALRYEKDEVAAILKLSDGIAVSAVSDWDYSELQKLSGHTRSSGGIFALHASEIIREDIDAILDLKPSFLVHMVQAQEFDFERVASEGIPIVVCPKANEAFGLRPRIDLMRKFGIDVALGTDNAMLSKPGILPAVQAAWEMSRQGGLRPRDVWDCALNGFRKVISVPEAISFETGQAANFFVAGNPVFFGAKDPLAALVGGASKAAVTLAVAGKYLWRRR